jgi:hypothetical protein
MPGRSFMDRIIVIGVVSGRFAAAIRFPDWQDEEKAT